MLPFKGARLMIHAHLKFGIRKSFELTSMRGMHPPAFIINAAALGLRSPSTTAQPRHPKVPGVQHKLRKRHFKAL